MLAVCSLAVALVILILLPGAGAEPPAEPRLLILALDAVPYDVVARLSDPVLGEKALFRGFHRPVPLISTFPSNTNVAFTGILEPLGVGKALGYEARFFDVDENRLRGAGPRSYHELEFSWREEFDWSTESLLRRMVGKVRPVISSVHGLDEAVEAFMASDDEVYLAYLNETDAAGHLKSPDSLVGVLMELDATLTAARRAHPERPFDTVLLSDHGMAGDGRPLANVRKPVRRSLKRAGFRIRSHLQAPRDVVFVELGLVSSFVLYTEEGTEAEVAGVAASVPGVDLCVYRHGGELGVVSRNGRAEIGHRAAPAGDLWSYRPLEGDPLDYRPVLAELTAGGKAGPGDLGGAGDLGSPGDLGGAGHLGGTGDRGRAWLPDARWFDATARTPYPDALYRLAQGFELVENSASVLCSTAPGHMYGAKKTQILAQLTVGRLKWTHGALFREASLGFLMTDVPGWEPPLAVRFDEALVPFARRVQVAWGRGEPGDVVTRLARVLGPLTEH